MATINKTRPSCATVKVNLHPDLRIINVNNEKESDQEQKGNGNEEQGNEVASRRRRIIRRYWKPVNIKEPRKHSSDQEKRDKGIAITSINTKNSFDALTEENEIEQLEESTGGNDNVNDQASEVKEARLIRDSIILLHKNG
ncbi:hypothetical protein KY290_036299 [Solanum tuberosum]|uniref:Uncharacterized protein n=1 Tax=Solanum tuberosum TaxID=4113 RepID=A0ABQ7TTL2_SOLTU|nr:hypothetical protein KY285_035580 [Solanum tuberosum]KAH0737594.1 hypothetical protein KY290_036299 [Solanum tuberosum]